MSGYQGGLLGGSFGCENRTETIHVALLGLCTEGREEVLMEMKLLPDWTEVMREPIRRSSVLSLRLKNLMILRGCCVKLPPGSRRMELVSCRELAAMWKLFLICATEEMKTRLKVLFSKIMLEKLKVRQKF